MIKAADFMYALWILKGRPVPAPGEIKRVILKQYAIKYKLKHFVETGTFNGDTVATLIDMFRSLDSIELSKELANRAKKRFANTHKVTIWGGNSDRVLKRILHKVKRPALFWLDAHGSGGITAQGKEWSPVLAELEAITKESQKKHVILIDDARGFTGHLSPTIQQIEDVVKTNHPKHEFLVKDDIIRIILK